MNEALFNELREASWRRPLTAEEETRLLAYLASHPEAQTLWDEETALNEQLSHVPDAPISSNFTAQVLQTIEAELAREARTAQSHIFPSRWHLRWLVPRLAVASLFLLLGVSGFHEYRASARAEEVRNVAFLSEMMALSGPEGLQNYEAIRSLPPETDDDLLAVLQ